ncbi:GP5a [Praja virus]|nr:GP5a [Praja virus]
MFAELGAQADVWLVILSWLLVTYTVFVWHLQRQPSQRNSREIPLCQPDVVFV